MRATLNIDDALLDQVMQFTESSNRSEAVRIALKAYIRQQEIRQIRAMRGTMDIDESWRELRALDTRPL
ncbi:MAG: type II toxin-antitoxin system VapB family antitoxin [Candidatus Hydrogenedentes bacterium]|nr:type II toxin-antitoxin system VapB family antitoxin [Candidatus Hydrogenedentota bacterium]